MDTLDCLMNRRTVRKFKNEPVKEEDFQKLMEAVRMAPSWANTQCVFWVVVDDPKLKEALQGTLPPGNPARQAIVEAPYVMALCAKKGLSGFYKGKEVTPYGDWFLFDAGLACQNFALAAHAMGYATVNVGLMDQKEAASILKLPEDAVLLELLPFGKPDGELPPAPKRKPIQELVHRNTYQTTY